MEWVNSFTNNCLLPSVVHAVSFSCPLIFSVLTASSSPSCFSFASSPHVSFLLCLTSAQRTRVSACFYIISKHEQQICCLMPGEPDARFMTWHNRRSWQSHTCCPITSRNPNPSCASHSWTNNTGKYINSLSWPVGDGHFTELGVAVNLNNPHGRMLKNNQQDLFLFV